MNKLEYLHECKNFLPKMVKRRRDLLKRKIGRPATPTMAKTMGLVDYFVSGIVDFEKMAKFIHRSDVKDGMWQIIPTRERTNRDHFKHLLNEATRLRQQTTQKHPSFSV